MIKNKDIIRLNCMEIIAQVISMQYVESDNVLVQNVSRSMIDLVNVLLEEIEK